jgi:hypothetical protein
MLAICRIITVAQQSKHHLRSHNLVFSLYQIRLVGILIIALFLSRLFIATFAWIFEPTLVRLSIQGFLINSLPLFPLSISLYLIGAGHRRSRRELKILPYICNSLPFLSVLCGVIFPVILLWNVNTAMAETAANKLTPYQQELISSSRIAPALVACIITSIGFYLISRQMQRLFAKYGVSCDQFFGERMA